MGLAVRKGVYKTHHHAAQETAERYGMALSEFAAAFPHLRLLILTVQYPRIALFPSLACYKLEMERFTLVKLFNDFLRRTCLRHGLSLLDIEASVKVTSIQSPFRI